MKEGIGRYWSRLRSAPVNTGIKICIDCGGAEISITEKSIKCKGCGAVHRRRWALNAKFQPGDLVRMVGADAGPDITYKIERISQDGDAIHYILRSKSSPITLFYTEGPQSRLEKAARGT